MANHHQQGTPVAKSYYGERAVDICSKSDEASGRRFNQEWG